MSKEGVKIGFGESAPTENREGADIEKESVGKIGFGEHPRVPEADEPKEFRIPGIGRLLEYREIPEKENKALEEQETGEEEVDPDALELLPEFTAASEEIQELCIASQEALLDVALELDDFIAAEKETIKAMLRDHMTVHENIAGGEEFEDEVKDRITDYRRRCGAILGAFQWTTFTKLRALAFGRINEGAFKKDLEKMSSRWAYSLTLLKEEVERLVETKKVGATE